MAEENGHPFTYGRREYDNRIEEHEKKINELTGRVRVLELYRAFLAGAFAVSSAIAIVLLGWLLSLKLGG